MSGVSRRVEAWVTVTDKAAGYWSSESLSCPREQWSELSAKVNECGKELSFFLWWTGEGSVYSIAPFTFFFTWVMAPCATVNKPSVYLAKPIRESLSAKWKWHGLLLQRGCMCRMHTAPPTPPPRLFPTLSPVPFLKSLLANSALLWQFIKLQQLPRSLGHFFFHLVFMCLPFSGLYANIFSVMVR